MFTEYLSYASVLGVGYTEQISVSAFVNVTFQWQLISTWKVKCSEARLTGQRERLGVPGTEGEEGAEEMPIGEDGAPWVLILYGLKPNKPVR